MARRPRELVPGGWFHVTVNAVHAQQAFLADHDREQFLARLAGTVDARGWQCHGYCLMGTHVHLLLETADGSLADGMQRLNGGYAQWFNRRYGRRGHLFGARYHAEVIRRHEHLLEVLRYVALNPVRAGVCSHPADWPWSSYRATAGLAPRPAFLSVAVLRLFAELPDRARARFRAFVLEAPDIVSTA